MAGRPQQGKQMKKLLGFLGAISLTATIAACSHSKKHEDAPPTPAQQAQSQLINDRTAYVNQTQARIDQLTKYSADLHTRSATAPKPNDKKLANAAEDLDSLISDAKKSLTEVQTAAPENWIDYKRDVDKSMTRVEAQYSNTMSLLR